MNAHLPHCYWREASQIGPRHSSAIRSVLELNYTLHYAANDGKLRLMTLLVEHGGT